MEIKIKIQPETLYLLQQMELHNKQRAEHTQADKFKQSIQLELFEKLSKWCISYSLNPNGKEKKITLKRHLAQQLLDDISDAIIYGNLDLYNKNKLHIIKNQLHQKLL